MCGHARTTFPHLQEFIGSAKGFLAARYLTNQEACDALCQSTPIKLSHFDNPDGWPLAALLHFFKGTSCTDPRDRIYALQNMASKPFILVDYTMDLVDLYWEVLWRCDTYDTELPRILSETLGVSDPGSAVLSDANNPGYIVMSPFGRHRGHTEAAKRGGGDAQEQ
jgi:hypothetical protein